MERRAARWTAALAALPLVALVAFVAILGVDVPYHDQWDLIPSLLRWKEGTAGWGDLWARHNEHRLVFPRALMYALASLSGWDVRWEMAVNVVLAAATFAIVARRLLAVAEDPAAIVVASGLVFSLAQWENWTWGWQLQIFLNVLSVAVVSELLAPDGAGAARVAGAALAATVATYSFACGVLVWPIAIGLAIAGEPDGRRRRIKAAALVLLGLAVVLPYVLSHERLEHHPTPWVFARRPLRFADYVITYLGAPLSLGPIRAAAFIATLFGFAVTGFALRDVPRLRPLAGLGLYALGAALITAVGRAGFGVPQSLASRYVTLSLLFWVWVLGVLVLWRASDDPRRRRAGTILLSMAGVAVLTTSSASIRHALVRSRDLDRARRALVTRTDPEGLGPLYPDRAALAARRELLERARLSVFR